jgi:hypothetical protein
MIIYLMRVFSKEEHRSKGFCKHAYMLISDFNFNFRFICDNATVNTKYEAYILENYRKPKSDSSSNQCTDFIKYI